MSNETPNHTNSQNDESPTGAECEEIRLTPFQVCLSIPFVLLGIALLAMVHLSTPPSAVPGSWEYATRYKSLYKIGGVLGIGTLCIGVLNTAWVGWVLHQHEWGQQ